MQDSDFEAGTPKWKMALGKKVIPYLESLEAKPEHWINRVYTNETSWGERYWGVRYDPGDRTIGLCFGKISVEYQRKRRG